MMNENCSFEACHERDGFFDVDDDAPDPNMDGTTYCVPFRCPEHGKVYEFLYRLDSIWDEGNQEIAYEY